MRSLALKEKIILAILLVAAAGFCFYYFLLSPQLKAYALAKEELADFQNKLSLAQITASTLKSESDKLEQARNDIKETGQLFSTEMRDGSDVILLGLKAANKNVEITDITPGEIKENEHSLQLPLSIMAQGDYRNMLNFCADQESLPNLSALKNIKFEVTGSLPPGFVKASFNLVIYSAKTPQNKLQLEQIARWATGRYNIFLSTGGIAPIPELAGHLKMPAVEQFAEDMGESAEKAVREDAGEGNIIPPATANNAIYGSGSGS